MKKLTAAILALLSLTFSISMSASALSASAFRDVSSGAWYYTAINYVANEGLFSGTSANTFSPNIPMTRAMFVRVLGNKAEIDPKQYPTSSFSDVNSSTWYGPYVEWAAQNGIVSGIGGGKFAPDESVTREQMTVILYNYAKLAGCGDIQNGTEILRFPDTGDVSDWAKEAMTWAVDKNIISGYGGKLNPKDTATRAQVAQIFYNIRNLLAGCGNETTDPIPDPTPTPDEPRIPITDEVRAKLRSNQDPEKILDYVMNGKHDDPTFTYDGTTAK